VHERPRVERARLRVGARGSMHVIGRAALTFDVRFVGAPVLPVAGLVDLDPVRHRGRMRQRALGLVERGALDRVATAR
jgi:hypothetical protein